MNNTITEQITKEKLQELFGDGTSWIGYLWQDDKSEPFVFLEDANQCTIDFLTNIPFIIEGFLVNKTKTTSLTIKNIDGMYYCYKSENFIDQTPGEIFPAHKVLKDKGIKALEFIPIFKKQDDLLSPNFQEYVYSHQIFKGIKS